MCRHVGNQHTSEDNTLSTDLTIGVNGDSTIAGTLPSAEGKIELKVELLCIGVV